MTPADSSMPLMVHLLLSFMRGITTSFKDADEAAPAPVPTKSGSDAPMPSNLLPVNDTKKKSKPAANMNTGPVNPVAQK